MHGIDQDAIVESPGQFTPLNLYREIWDELFVA